MPILTLQLPRMYGDHHVVAVRSLLLGISGVQDVYASSSFQVAEILFDESVVNEERIRSTLDDAGYLRALSIPVESSTPVEQESREKALFRHTASIVQAGNVVGFTQKVPISGKVLWPCPGLKREKLAKEVQVNGQEN